VSEHSRIVFDDLGCTVYLDVVPAWASAELPTLYESSFAVVEYFRIFDGVTALSACVLSQPRHVVFFTRSGSTAIVLNQLFDIDAMAAQRVCDALFRALPTVRRVRFNGSRLDPKALGVPTRVLAHSEDVVIDLPETYEAYVGTLGASMRKNLPWFSNRLTKTFPEHETVTCEQGGIPEALARAIINLNRKRMATKGETDALTSAYEARVIEFARSYGLCVALVLRGEVIAGTIGSLVGRDYYGHIQAFDPDYAKYRLGTICLQRTIRECIDRKVEHLHTLWGQDDYKKRLGGVPQTLCAFAVYRSGAGRLVHVDDALRAAWWHAQRGRLATSAVAARSSAGSWMHRHGHRDA
jgi:CelD/BcsL family acetyltransferase involved in cellulose biosynthesis